MKLLNDFKKSTELKQSNVSILQAMQLSGLCHNILKLIQDHPTQWNKTTHHWEHPIGIKLWVANGRSHFRLEGQGADPEMLTSKEYDILWSTYLTWIQNIEKKTLENKIGYYLETNVHQVL